jgi:hypothetical protein
VTARAAGLVVTAASVAATIGVAAGCGAPKTRDVRATILDEEGRPVPGAVFYAEAYDATGPFAFLSARSGTAGEVPDSAREPLKLPWRGGARVALAAFADGFRPAVRRDPTRPVESDGALLVLVRGDEADPAAVEELGFPFTAGGAPPALAEAASAPEHAPLREAFARARAARAEPVAPPAGSPPEKTLQDVDDSADS